MYQQNIIVKSINSVLQTIEKNKNKIEIINLFISWVKIKDINFNKLELIKNNNGLILRIGKKEIINFKYVIIKQLCEKKQKLTLDY